MTLVDPRNYLAVDTLRDGTVVTIRAIRPDDRGRLLEAFRKLDHASIYRRFFNPKRELTDAELKQFTEVDFDHVVALVVTTKAAKAEIMVAGGRSLPSLPPAAPKSPSPPRRTIEAVGSPACCWPASLGSPERRACRNSTPMCLRKTSRCSASFDAAAYRCNSAARVTQFTWRYRWFQKAQECLLLD